MSLLRSHPLVVGLVAATAGAMVAVFMLARPSYEPETAPAPPDNDLPYTAVKYDVADALRAFAVQDIALVVRSRAATTTTLGNADDLLEVDVFGDPEEVKASGFYDYTVENGRYVPFAKTCSPGTSTAERWHGNVRVIVNCSAAGAAAGRWLRQVNQAFARL